jgi:hypothetical protein
MEQQCICGCSRHVSHMANQTMSSYSHCGLSRSGPCGIHRSRVRGAGLAVSRVAAAIWADLVCLKLDLVRFGLLLLGHVVIKEPQPN